MFSSKHLTFPISSNQKSFGLRELYKSFIKSDFFINFSQANSKDETFIFFSTLVFALIRLIPYVIQIIRSFTEILGAQEYFLNFLDSNYPKVSLNNKVVISEELSAADLMVLQKNKISGLISEQGGPEGHFAIIARSLSIPTVVGVKGILDVLKNGEKIIIDGDNGFVI